MDRGAVVKALLAQECTCGRKKKPRQSFCRHCYFKLPEYMRKLLYQKMFDGYEQAYANAIEYLETGRNERRANAGLLSF